jgi:hypothetical protein
MQDGEGRVVYVDTDMGCGDSMNSWRATFEEADTVPCSRCKWGFVRTGGWCGILSGRDWRDTLGVVVTFFGGRRKKTYRLDVVLLVKRTGSLKESENVPARRVFIAIIVSAEGTGRLMSSGCRQFGFWVLRGTRCFFQVICAEVYF